MIYILKLYRKKKLRQLKVWINLSTEVRLPKKIERVFLDFVCVRLYNGNRSKDCFSGLFTDKAVIR